MLRLVPILPCQINHELVGILIFTSIKLGNVLLPASRWRLPGRVLSRLRLIRVERMVAVLPRPLVARGLRGTRIRRWPTALLGLLSRGGGIKNLLTTADLDEILL